MEFSSVWYFSFCSIVSLLFLIPGLHSLDKAALPVPDLVMLLIKILIPFSTCTWSSYAYLFRPLLEHAELHKGYKLKQFYAHLSFFIFIPFILVYGPTEKLNQSSPWFIIVFLIRNSVPLISSFLVLLPIRVRFKDSKTVGSFLTGFFGPLVIYPNHTLCWILFTNLHFLVAFAQFSSGECSIFFVFLYYWFYSVCALHLYLTSHLWFKNSLFVSNPMSYVYRKRKAIEAIAGLSGILIAHYFTIENSGVLVFALACLSVSWLATLVMNQPATDLGIFSFLISACVECAVNVFGFHVYTWLVFGFSVLLISIRWNIDSISLHYTGMQEAVMRKWKNLEQLCESRYQMSPERETEIP